MRVRRVRSHGFGALAGFLAALGLAACATLPSAAPSHETAAAPSSPAASAALSGAPTAGPSSRPAVVIDPSLLAVLPETVSGIAVVESPDGEAEALGDPGLAKVASAIASGVAVDRGASDPAALDLVYAVVVRLIPGALDEARYRDWRDSYDEGACSQAGGVVGHAEATIDGRTTYIGTCAGGMRTYHVWLPDSNLLVSASSLGERRLGEKLIEDLRP